METKCTYEVPLCEVYEVEVEGCILSASQEGIGGEGFSRDEEIGWG